jgi:hypothetical protein
MQWPKEEAQSIQWPKGEAESIQWPKEEAVNTMAKRRSTAKKKTKE